MAGGHPDASRDRRPLGADGGCRLRPHGRGICAAAPPGAGGPVSAGARGQH